MSRSKPIPWPPSAAPAPVVAEFSVVGEPVPWRAPMVTRNRNTYSPKHVRAWKAQVSRAAAAAMAGRPPHAGPVSLRLRFSRPAPKARRREFWWAARPDLSNLVKAVEDALNGVVYADDNQVVSMRALKVRGPAGVEVLVREAS